MSKRRTIIIDGDLLCYKIALGAEQSVNWADEGSPDLWTVWADAAETKARFKSAIYSLKERLNAYWAVIAVTRDFKSFRKELLPSYKGNRTAEQGGRKPILLGELRTFCVEHFGALEDPRLEADDIMGILQTGGTVCGERIEEDAETVIVSDDKDMKTIPGKHYHLSRQELYDVSPLEADNFHLIQTLAGDVTDNYAGCPGIGMERAREAVEQGIAWERYEHTLKSGPRKGRSEWRWERVKALNPWHTVESHFAKAGAAPGEELTQARMARILRATEYTNEEIALWQPR